MTSRRPSSPAARNEYDSFADIYSVWTDTAASARANLSFYVDAYLAADGPVVELGVGDGRIAVEAAARGCPVIGVDLSSAMLERCRQRAAQAAVLGAPHLAPGRFPHVRPREPGRLSSACRITASATWWSCRTSATPSVTSFRSSVPAAVSSSTTS